ILDYALDPDQPNPATLRALKRFLPKISHRQQHRKMLPLEDVPKLVSVLRSVVAAKSMMVGSQRRCVGHLGTGNVPGKRNIASFGFELVILTGARLGEVHAATWADFDRDKKIWTVREHKTGRYVGDQRRPITRAMEVLLDEVASRVDCSPGAY